jgi:putative spermidine/putrescine transport system ATP-binding protein
VTGTATVHGAPIALRRIVKRYGAMLAVNELSLDIAAGEFVSFLGPSGSGKTTALLMIAGFVAPTAGEIMLGNADITSLPPYRRNIGMVYQNYALFPHMTVARNIAFPLRMRGMARGEIARRVARALDLVRLAGLDERLPNQLSGGQQQRVALARALVFEPPLLLLDEPLGALDKKLREELQIEIKRIQRTIGSTMIYVTHDQDEALSMSDRIAVMSRGRIEQVGAPSELYERPRTRFVAEFLGSSNFLEATVIARGDRLLLRTTGGLAIEMPRSLAAAVGDRFTLSIRPERIRLAERGARDGAWHPARVIDSFYHGDTQRFQVEVEGCGVMTVFRPNLGQALLSHGAQAAVSWRNEDAWIIPERDDP